MALNRSQETTSYFSVLEIVFFQIHLPKRLSKNATDKVFEIIHLLVQ
jgi:hypothetical protein